MLGLSDNKELSMRQSNQSSSLLKVKATMRSTLDTGSEFRRFNSHKELEKSMPRLQEAQTKPSVYEKFNLSTSKKPQSRSPQPSATGNQASLKKTEGPLPSIVDIWSPEQGVAQSTARQRLLKKAYTGKLADSSQLKQLFSTAASKDERMKDLEQELRELKIKYARMVAVASEASGKHPETLEREETLWTDAPSKTQVETAKLSKMAGKVKQLLDEQQKIVGTNFHLVKGKPTS